jgi:hypothetical protein
VLLEQRDPLAELVELPWLCLGEVPLHTEMPEDRGARAEVQLVMAPGRVRLRRGDVRPHQLRWDQLRGPPVHQLPLQGVDDVRDPDAVGPLQDTQIHSGASRRAGLDLQTGVSALDLVEQAVERRRLLVHTRPAVRLSSGVDEIAVVIPLDVVDVVLVQDGEDRVPDVAVALLDTEIDHLLVSRLDRQPTSRSHDPLRMRPGDVGVNVDHLGLEPQAELHAEALDGVDQRMQTMRPHVRGDGPVAKSGGVTTALPEPSVVEHIALDANLRGGLGELDQPVEIMVEVDGFPHVERDRPHSGRVVGPRPEIAVEPVGDLVQTDAVRPVEPR